MKFNNLITPAILSCAFAFSAHAMEPVAADATDYNFATIKAGLVQPTNLGGTAKLNTGDNTFTTGVLVGRKFKDMFSVDVEYMFRGKNTAESNNANAAISGDNTSWKMRSDTFMLNVSVDLIQDPKIRPYLRAGAGVSRNKSYDYTYTDYATDPERPVSNSYAGKTVNKFAWQIGVGTTFKTNDMLETQLEYMYVDRGGVETSKNYTRTQEGSKTKTIPSSSLNGKMKDHVITVGLKIKF